MSIAGILSYGSLKKLSGRVHTTQIKQRDALIHFGDLQFGIRCRSLFKRLQRFFEELLVHVGCAAIVETSGFGGLVRLRRVGNALRSGCETSNRGQNDATNDEDLASHAKNKLTTKGTKVHKGKSRRREPEFDLSRPHGDRFFI